MRLAYYAAALFSGMIAALYGTEYKLITILLIGIVVILFMIGVTLDG